MKVPHNKITFDESEVSAVQDVVRSGFWVGGAVQKRLEERLSNLFSARGAVCVGSGLSALRLSLLALGVGKDHEVIIPAYCCVALANAVLSVGAVPVSVDIERNTLNLSVDAVQSAITQKTKAIIAVNTFGAPAKINALKKFNIPVIEDCSHGFKVNADNIPQKIEGDVAIFSFYATKLIAGGEGGAILSSNKNVINFCKQQRDYTDQLPDGNRLNDKMTDIEAALVESQLDKLGSMLSKRKNIAQRYSENLEEMNASHISDDRVWYRYIIQVKENLDEVIEKFENKGVSVRKPVENWLEERISNYPNAYNAYTETLSIPLYPILKTDEQNFVIQTIKEVIKV